jgi:hypothetical protein
LVTPEPQAPRAILDSPLPHHKPRNVWRNAGSKTDLLLCRQTLARIAEDPKLANPIPPEAGGTPANGRVPVSVRRRADVFTPPVQPGMDGAEWGLPGCESPFWRFAVTVSVAMLRRRRQDGVGEELAELAALADGSLPPEGRAALEARVAASSELAERLAEQERAVTLTRTASAEVEAPAALRARIEAQRRPRRAPVSRRLVAVGAAAAVAVVVVIGLAVFRSSSSETRFRAALAATPLAPGAKGEATLTKTSSGWRIELDATGLPRLDGGRFYEAWLRNGSGTLVPVGTFNEGTNVTLWAGVSPKLFKTVTVTRERADGDQRSSGEKVLVGAVSTDR